MELEFNIFSEVSLSLSEFFFNVNLQLLSIFLAVIFDLLTGDPKWLKHPVEIIGLEIDVLTKLLNRGSYRKVKGLIMWCLVLLTTIFSFCLILYLSFQISFYLFFFLYIWFLSTALASKSLFQACRKAVKPLEENNLKEARIYTGEIVGRETQNLDKDELLRAILETEAESGIDGIISPLFYMFLGILLSRLTIILNPLTIVYFYKAVNTMDSMVGYKLGNFKEFGFFPARLDDLFNFIPARLGSLLYFLSALIQGFNIKSALSIYFRDKNNHSSPNAGHPEAMIAGILGIQLGGINTYFGQKVFKPTIGSAFKTLDPGMVKKEERIILGAEILMILISSIITLVR